jgi:heat shock protein HslJ
MRSRIARASTTLILFLFCICLHADEDNPQKITVTGTLSRAMAIGAETTGWILQVSSETVIDGKPISSIEVSDTRKPKQLDDFANKVVKISGKVVYRHGVETGTQPYIEVQTIKVVAKPISSSPAQPLPFSLVGTAWSLEDLAGQAMNQSAHATLTFPDTDKVAGSGSCNRFFGPAKITGDHIALGPLASSRMACPEPVMAQETAYLLALQASERFSWEDPYLIIYFKGSEKPLRFSRAPNATSSTP